MKYTSFILILVVLAGFGCGSTPPEITEVIEIQEEPEIEIEPVIELPPLGAALPVSAFGEVWVYVVEGRETFLRPGLPISDIGYFSADINIYGKLVDIPNRRKLPAVSGTRVHLVVKCDGRALTHFVLVPGSTERKSLIADLLAASGDYDGLQIDFEYVPLQDGDAFLSFLAELKAGCGKKMFTIALPARSKKIAGDVYDYNRIKPLVDRILVMAYDEHWSTSAPGSIASLAWCRRVADYSLGVIGREKLIMGIPFYGRAWGNVNPSQAYIYSTIERIINENNIKEIRREEGIPTFDYNVPVSVKVYYEDAYSISTRMEIYRTMGVGSIGFWRLGQETAAVWKQIKLEKY